MRSAWLSDRAELCVKAFKKLSRQHPRPPLAYAIMTTMRMKYAALFACAMPFAALAGIVPGKDGPLVRSEDSKPVFLV